MYLIVAKMTKHFGTMYKSVISSVEVYIYNIGLLTVNIEFI